LWVRVNDKQGFSRGLGLIEWGGEVEIAKVGVESKRLGRFWWRDRHTDSNLARNLGKGSCSVCFLLVISITLCLMIEIACNLSVCALFYRGFWVFPRNCLAVQSLPPGGTSVMSFCSCFGLNRLTAMNSCQAARLRSRSLLMFVAIRASAYVFLWLMWRGFIGHLPGLKWITQLRNEKGWGMIMCELIWVAHEGEYRATFMKRIEGRKLVSDAGMVVSWWLNWSGWKLKKRDRMRNRSGGFCDFAEKWCTAWRCAACRQATMSANTIFAWLKWG